MAYRYPKLRGVDARSYMQDGQTYILLQDPLHLTEKMLLVPQALGPALAMCDGTQEDAAALSAAMAVRHGIRVNAEVIEELLAALDGALLLDNAASTQALAQALTDYRNAPFRSPSLAGKSYPAERDELQRVFDDYLKSVADDPSSTIPSPPISATEATWGLVSPHIDYQRGGPIYAKVWRHAKAIVKAADLVVILGTDHMGSVGHWTLTRQHYATPLGKLPTSREVVNALGDALGEEAAFAEELHHRSEHSIELAAVWLHHMREGQPCEVVPMLCGSFRHFIEDGADAAHDSTIGALVDTFKTVTRGRRVLIVAAADLSHVGPAFGGRPIDFIGRARLRAADDELIERMCAGDAAGFLTAIRRVRDKNNVCGVPPIYLMLRILGGQSDASQVAGELVGYDRCPADERGSSLVSICGILFT